jgi:hypothetical protein
MMAKYPVRFSNDIAVSLTHLDEIREILKSVALGITFAYEEKYMEVVLRDMAWSKSIGSRV